MSFVPSIEPPDGDQLAFGQTDEGFVATGFEQRVSPEIPRNQAEKVVEALEAFKKDEKDTGLDQFRFYNLPLEPVGDNVPAPGWWALWVNTRWQARKSHSSVWS